MLGLYLQGYSEREIANKLRLVISQLRDLIYPKKQAQENLEIHIHKIVSEEYQKYMIGMKRNLEQTLEIAEIAETAADLRSSISSRKQSR